MAVALARSLTDIFSGHHYWTGIFGACFVLFGKKEKSVIGNLLNWRIILSLVFCIFLHSFFNFGAMIGGVGQYVVQLIFVEIPSVAATIVLINIGIAQFKLNAIYEAKKSKDDEESEAQSSFCDSADTQTDDVSDKEKPEEVNV